MRVTRTTATVVALGASLLLAGCGEARRGRIAPYTAHGLTVRLPAGWQHAQRSLTPDLVDPREVLAVGTYPLRHRPGGCAHVPGAALEDLGPTDAFITLQERGRRARSSWTDFPARPKRFGRSPARRLPGAGCVRNARLVDHWFGFTDGGRHFHVEVAFGERASAATRERAWGILDALRVDPDVRPDWRSSG